MHLLIAWFSAQESSIPSVIYCATYTLVASQTTHHLQALRSGLYKCDPWHGSTITIPVRGGRRWTIERQAASGDAVVGNDSWWIHIKLINWKVGVCDHVIQYLTAGMCVASATACCLDLKLMDQSQEYYWVKPYSRVANTEWPSYRRIARLISNKVYYQKYNDTSDRKLFRQATQPGFCLHHLFPPKTSNYISYQLRKWQHPYLLPTLQYSVYKLLHQLLFI